MFLPGLLIEYLVIGATASIWILPLLGLEVTRISDQATAGGAFILLAPVGYVVGMLVAQLAKFLLSWPYNRKFNIQERAVRYLERRRSSSYGEEDGPLPKGSSAARLRVSLAETEPQILLQEVNMRRSRDRIARATVVNLAMAGSVYAHDLGVAFLAVDGVLAWALGTAIFACAVLFAFWTWAYLEAESDAFEEEVNNRPRGGARSLKTKP
jgi:hypothetical protein